MIDVLRIKNVCLVLEMSIEQTSIAPTTLFLADKIGPATEYPPRYLIPALLCPVVG